MHDDMFQFANLALGGHKCTRNNPCVPLLWFAPPLPILVTTNLVGHVSIFGRLPPPPPPPSVMYRLLDNTYGSKVLSIKDAHFVVVYSLWNKLENNTCEVL